MASGASRVFRESAETGKVAPHYSDLHCVRIPSSYGELTFLKHWLSGCVCCLLIFLVTAADARVRWSTPGSYRLRWVKSTPYGLDNTEIEAPERAWFRHRLRVGPQVEAGPVRVFIQLDVLTGQIHGDTTGLGSDFVEKRQTDPADRFDGWTTLEPRFAWAELDFEWVGLKAGQMPRHWGMGLLPMMVKNTGVTDDGFRRGAIAGTETLPIGSSFL